MATTGSTDDDRFKARLLQLNKQFFSRFSEFMQTAPEADYSELCKKYLIYVDNLDSEFTKLGNATTLAQKQQDERPKKTAQRRPLVNEEAPNVRTPGFASSQIAKSSTNSFTPQITSDRASSTPASGAPQFNISNISIIKPTFTPEVAAEKSTVDKTLLDAGTSAAAASSNSRKRAIRGGGPLGGGEEVIFRGTDSLATANSVTSPPITLKFPAPSTDFWKQSSTTATTTTEADKKSQFSGWLNASKSTGDTNGKNGGNKSGGGGGGGGDDDAEPSAAKKAAAAPPAATKDEPKKPLFPSLFGSQDSSSSSSTTATATTASTKPVFGGFTFGSGATTSTLSSSTTASKPLPFSGFSFGSKTTTTTEPAKEGEDKGDDEPEEPPKVEIVENEEPDAYLSMKCSVFKRVDGAFKKLGVGQLYLKDADGTKSVLLRAATATGAVWLNARTKSVNTTVQTKGNEKGDKLTISAPTSPTEVDMFVLRFQSKNDVARVVDEIKTVKEDGAAA